MTQNNTTTLDPDELVHRALRDLLANPVGLRSILTDMMTTALHLSIKARWDSQDNYTFTEGAVQMLATHLPELTAHQVAELCEHFDLTFEDVDTTLYPMPQWNPDREHNDPTTEAAAIALFNTDYEGRVDWAETERSERDEYRLRVRAEAPRA